MLDDLPGLLLGIWRNSVAVHKVRITLPHD